MQFSASALLALVASVAAQTANFDPITKPLQNEVLTAGSTCEVDWETNNANLYPGTITIELLGGSAPDKLVTLGPVGTKVENDVGKFCWNIDPSLGQDATYGIRITLDSDQSVFQYSFPFKIQGTSQSDSSSVLSTVASIASIASSSSDSVESTPSFAAPTNVIVHPNAIAADFSTPTTFKLPTNTTVVGNVATLKAVNLSDSPTQSTFVVTGFYASKTGFAADSTAITVNGGSSLSAGPITLLSAMVMAILLL